jgi:hypothetical protein
MNGPGAGALPCASAGATLYQTLTASPLGQPYPGATRFLDSFQLIARVHN